MSFAIPTLRAIVFDFDGVILESVNVKTRAFAELFRHHPKHVDRIVQLHLDNLGVSRYEKFRTIYRDFLQRPLSEAEMAHLDVRFSEIVFGEILKCAFVPGARRFLERASASYSLYVASATPEEELRRIVKARGLDSVFRGVYGSPRVKAEIVEGILRDEGLQPREVLFVGDARTDYRSAASNGVAFIGRVAPGEVNPFASVAVPTVADLAELDREWASLVARLGE